MGHNLALLCGKIELNVNFTTQGMPLGDSVSFEAPRVQIGRRVGLLEKVLKIIFIIFHPTDLHRIWKRYRDRSQT